MKTLLGLLVIVVALWYYFSRMREQVTSRARMICRQNGMQLLDQTLALKQLHLSASFPDIANPVFEYHFEISYDGMDRYRASAFVRNRHIIQVIIFHPEGNIIIHDRRRPGENSPPDIEPEKMIGEA